MGLKEALDLVHLKLGTPYKLGAKWSLADKDPKGPIDCSGFARFFAAQAGISIPDGSYNQITVCKRLPEVIQAAPPAGSLGFFAPHKTVDHVVVVYDDQNVIEARGEPHNAVILRPIKAWLNQPGFLGFYSLPANTPQEFGLSGM